MGSMEKLNIVVRRLSALNAPQDRPNFELLSVAFKAPGFKEKHFPLQYLLACVVLLYLNTDVEVFTEAGRSLENLGMKAPAQSDFL